MDSFNLTCSSTQSTCLFVGYDILKAQLAALGLRARRVFIVTQQLIYTAHAERLNDALSTGDFTEQQLILVPDGEQAKHMDCYTACLNQIFEKGVERSDIIIGFGGGVVTDLAGFLAASCLRGVRLIHIPTTLLGQVDAAIGGKTGINHATGKNLIGAFYQPIAVLIDIFFLTTLPKDQAYSGLAEVIKYALIGNAPLLALLQQHSQTIQQFEFDADRALWHTLIQHAVQQKCTVVSEDEKEAGCRATLNFGHTIGHAIEAYFSFKTYSHGQCVAYGMLAVIELAEKKGCLNPQDAHTLITFIQAFRYHNVPLRPLDHDAIIALIQRDKKVQHGNVTFILPTGIGAVARDTTVSAAEIRASLTWLATCCTP